MNRYKTERAKYTKTIPKKRFKKVLNMIKRFMEKVAFGKGSQNRLILKI